MYKKRISTATITQAQAVTVSPTIIDQSGLFAYDSNGDLIPVSTVSTATDTLYELDGSGDIEPQA